MQCFLCIVFLAVGCAKIFLPKDKLLAMMHVYSKTPIEWVRVLGFLEVLAAAGIVLPSLLGIAPYITTLTAALLAVAMVGAVAVHAARKEYKQMLLPILSSLAAISVIVLRW
jgi:hypothetical protein